MRNDANDAVFLDFAKNPRPYGDKLIKVDLTIVQIFEYEEYGREITSFVASDANFHYYRGYMFGYSTGIYEGTNITMVALPISYFEYQNLIGGQTYAIAWVAITIEKR